MRAGTCMSCGTFPRSARQFSAILWRDDRAISGIGGSSDPGTRYAMTDTRISTTHHDTSISETACQEPSKASYRDHLHFCPHCGKELLVTSASPPVHVAR